jgi:Fur family transcriptional regulator, ferric uptake regulator
MASYAAAVGTERLDDVLGVIRASGGRVTSTRQVVLRAVLDAGEHHFTAADISDAVVDAVPKPDRATVYRTLELLVELGIVTVLQYDGGAAIYHRADPPHGHLVCDHCGSVVELPAAALDAVVAAIREHAEFTIDPARVAISGTCATCEAHAGPHVHAHVHRHP